MQLDTIWEDKTIEGAISRALDKMKLKREEVDIEIIQEPARGIFGITKIAKVKITPKEISGPEEGMPGKNSAKVELPSENQASDENEESAHQAAMQALEKTLILMGIKDFRIKVHVEEGNVIFDITSEAEGLLIGRHGKTREALQYLINKMSGTLERGKNSYLVDIGGYLNRHKATLEKIARRVVKHVKENNKEEHLQAMTPYDRRIVHLYLKDEPEITTYSEGEGALRHIVIAPQKKPE